MERRLAALSRFHKRMIYIGVTLLWLTGTLWYAGHLRLDAQGSMPNLESLQHFLLRIHGALAMGFLVLLGTLLPLHISRGWQQKSQRFSGGSVFTACVVLTVTGWGLYYLGDRVWRDATAVAHTYLGLLLPVIIFIHVRAAKAKLKSLTKDDHTTKGDLHE